MQFQPSQFSDKPYGEAVQLPAAPTSPAAGTADDKGYWESMSPLGKAYAATAVVAWPTAMAVSYKRNESIGWAFLSGIVWPAYLIYTFGFSDGATKQS